MEQYRKWINFSQFINQIYLLANKLYMNACIQYYFIFVISRLVNY